MFVVRTNNKILKWGLHNFQISLSCRGFPFFFFWDHLHPCNRLHWFFSFIIFPFYFLLLLLLVLRRSLQIPIPAWAMKATVFSSSGRGPYSFVCMSTLSLQMDCLTLLYSLQSCSTCWAVSAACPQEQRSVSPTLNILWMWYCSRLCPVLSLKMVVWPRLFRQYTPSCSLYSGWLSFHLLFRLVYIMDFTSLYVRSLSICSSTDPSFASLSARSFPSILQWVSILQYLKFILPWSSDTIDQNIYSAADNVESGNDQLIKAAEYQVLFSTISWWCFTGFPPDREIGKKPGILW